NKKGITVAITFVGGGNMASALIGGLLQQDFSPEQLCVVEISPEGREKLQRAFKVQVVSSLAKGAAQGDVIVLAVKPQQLPAVARELAPMLENHLVISIAAGIHATAISRWMGGHTRVVRAMPNTPALVRAAVTGLYAMAEVSTEEKRKAEAILEAVGSVLWVENEELLDAITAISGSGPAYVFYFIEAMQIAARELGLTPAQARQMSVDTFLGAARLAHASSEDAAVLRARVTSPGGTTERAIANLEQDGVKRAIVRAMHAASQRSRELADEFGNK
ncbi:MAG TPA: pyrroline-5-carboxylate reductase, partial [Nitrosospira sp.]|nr:pyrroline-5-carboxylate reductase [Nitrosospira sp.]